MQLHQVRYFLAVCDHQSFTRAATFCRVTQPALTRAIRKLEDEMGGALLERDSSGAQLTRFGRSVKPFLEQVARAADAARIKAKSLLRSQANHLRLGMSPAMSPALVMRPLREIRQRVEGVALEMSQSDTEAILHKLVDGEIELAVVASGDTLPERLHRWPLYEEGHVLALPEGHPMAALPEVAVEALDRETWIDRPYCRAAQSFLSFCEDRGVQLEIRHAAATDDQVQHLVSAGFGCALLPAFHPLMGGVAVRPVQGFDVCRTAYLVAMAGRPFTPISDIFVRLARARDWSGA